MPYKLMDDPGTYTGELNQKDVLTNQLAFGLHTLSMSCGYLPFLRLIPAQSTYHDDQRGGKF